MWIYVYRYFVKNKNANLFSLHFFFFVHNKIFIWISRVFNCSIKFEMNQLKLHAFYHIHKCEPKNRIWISKIDFCQRKKKCAFQYLYYWQWRRLMLLYYNLFADDANVVMCMWRQHYFWYEIPTVNYLIACDTVKIEVCYRFSRFFV